jgi:hypothetical protein
LEIPPNSLEVVGESKVEVMEHRAKVDVVVDRISRQDPAIWFWQNDLREGVCHEKGETQDDEHDFVDVGLSEKIAEAGDEGGTPPR